MTSDWPRVLFEFYRIFIRKWLRKWSLAFLNDHISDIFTDQSLCSLDIAYEWRRSTLSKFCPWRSFEYSRYSRLYAYEYVFIILTKIIVSSVFKIFIFHPRNPSYDRRYRFHPNNRIALKLSGLKNTAVCDTGIRWTFYYWNLDLFHWWNFVFCFLFVKLIISDLNNFDLILNSKIYRNRTDIRTSIWCLYLFRFW